MNTKVDEGKLISGKEALIALANGEEVEYLYGENNWLSVIEMQVLITAFTGSKFKFRLKPRTIKINGIEVPCCGENYQEGEQIYVFDDCCDDRGYIEFSAGGCNYEDLIPKLWWRTEEEIKQVVAALRQVFGGSHDN